MDNLPASEGEHAAAGSRQIESRKACDGELASKRHASRGPGPLPGTPCIIQRQMLLREISCIGSAGAAVATPDTLPHNVTAVEVAEKYVCLRLNNVHPTMLHRQIC